MNQEMRSIAIVLVVAALGMATVRPAYAQPAAPTVTLNPAAVNGKVNAMTITFTVNWAPGWDGSKLGSEMNNTYGHVHFMIDGPLPSMHFASPGSTSTQRAFTFATGSHTVAVELVNPNHMPYDPTALSSTSFEVTITEEGQLIIDKINSLNNGLGTLTGLLYGVLGLSVIAIVVGGVAVAQSRSLRKTALR